MNRVEFHYNISDKTRYLQRLLGKVLERNMTALVLCPVEQLSALDERLWADQPDSFLPHCPVGAASATLLATPVWLASEVPDGHDRQVLINWGTLLPKGPGSVQRWLELVSTEPADAQAGRQRWRHYQAIGCAIEPHDRTGRDR
jgi:DNA polymerase-3 subunit chi